MFNYKLLAGVGLLMAVGTGAVAFTLSSPSPTTALANQASASTAPKVAYSTLDHTMGVRFDIMKSQGGSTLISASSWVPPKIGDLLDPFKIGGGVVTLDIAGIIQKRELIPVGGSFVTSIPTAMLMAPGDNQISVELKGDSLTGENLWETSVGYSF